MNFIITGGTGFIGTHLTNLLIEKFPKARIYNLDIVKSGTPNPVVKNYKKALKDWQELSSFWVNCVVRNSIDNLPFEPTEDDIIFNFAAVHRTPGHEDHEYFETNIFGAENVTAFAEKYGIKKIVFTSSIAPYGAAEELKTENTLPTPNTAYGISKLVAEKIHEKWQNRDFMNRKLTILRSGVVFGKGENGNFIRLYWALRKNRFAYPGRRDTIKACIYVKELVNFMTYCVENQIAGEEIFNCCYEPAYTIEHIVESMKKVTGLCSFVPDIPNWFIMPFAATLGALGAPMGICPARVKKLQISTNICGKKLKETSYKFKWNFEEALNDWYKDNDSLYLQ